MLETFFCLNTLLFTIFTWYSLRDERLHQETIAYTSVTSTIAVLLLIIICHVYTYTSLLSNIKKTKLGRKIDRLLIDTDPKPKPMRRQCRYSPPPDNDYNRYDDRELLDELDCPVYTGDYDTTPLLKPPPVEPTFSVVELHHPCLAAPDHTEEANTQNTPPKSTD